MKYKFPKITHIDQVRRAIAAHGHDEFIEAEREGFTVFNYLVNKPNTFPSLNTLVFDIESYDDNCENDIQFSNINEEDATILRECRGLTFYPDGTVAARKFHKFFNLNERLETEFRKINWVDQHVILEKLDGSMLTPFMRDGKIEWHTKMGATDVAKMVDPFIKNNPNYNEAARSLINASHTPIFEFCSRKNRVVIDHPVDRLVLLAARDNITGEYYNYEELVILSSMFNLELVRQYEGTIETMEAFVEGARGEPDIEGYVIRFEDGHMLKVKADIYLALHKAVSKLSQEKDVWQLVVEDKIDDLKAILPDDQRSRLDDFAGKFWKKFDELVDGLVTGVQAARDEIDAAYVDQESVFDGDGLMKAKKKEYALHHADKFGYLKQASFQVFDGKDAREIVKNVVLSNVRTKTKVDAFRKVFDGLEWTEFEIDED